MNKGTYHSLLLTSFFIWISIMLNQWQLPSNSYFMTPEKSFLFSVSSQKLSMLVENLVTILKWAPKKEEHRK